MRNQETVEDEFRDVHSTCELSDALLQKLWTRRQQEKNAVQATATSTKLVRPFFTRPFFTRRFASLPPRCVVIAWAIFGLTSGPVTTCLAQGLPDRVIVRTESGNGRKTFYGTIESYGSRFLTIRLLRRGTLQDVPVDQIIKVETPLTASHISALERFHHHEIETARSQFLKALKDETRNWVQDDLRGMLVRCDARHGKFVAAAERFIPLVDDDSRSRHFDFVPLTWQPVQESDLEKPKRWLRQKSETGRLLAGAILLEDDKLTTDAQRVLQKLKRSGDPVIRQLADVQLWRLRLQQADTVRDGELQGWQSRLRLLPERHRGPAHFLIGCAQIGRLEYDNAVLSLLRTPLVYAEFQPRLAVQSARRAVEALRKSGRSAQATAMLAEIATKYPDFQNETPLRDQPI